MEAVNDRKMVSYSGSVLAHEIAIDELTDVTPGTTDKVTIEIEDCRHIKDLLVDIVIDKGCTIDVVRYADKQKQQTLKPFVQQVIADLGSSESFTFEKIGCYRVDVVVTKTEAGATTGLVISPRGEG